MFTLRKSRLLAGVVGAAALMGTTAAAQATTATGSQAAAPAAETADAYYATAAAVVDANGTLLREKNVVSTHHVGDQDTCVRLVRGLSPSDVVPQVTPTSSSEDRYADHIATVRYPADKCDGAREIQVHTRSEKSNGSFGPAHVGFTLVIP